MRVLSLVTLVSPDGAYGGPVRVALNQARALNERGHEVTLAGGQRGFGAHVPTEMETVPVSLFPVRTVLAGTGFAGLASPALHRWLSSAVTGVDIVHVHAARDLVTLRAADWLRRHHIPYVLQTHGMIDTSRNALAVPLDAVMTRPTLRAAQHVFYLTPRERSDLINVGGSALRLRELPNGVPRPTSTTERAGSEVLYLARLAARKRPASFIEMAERLARAFPQASFRMVGPDEGEGDAVRRRISTLTGTVDIAWEGPLEPGQTTARMEHAGIYVLPAVDEPYPMSVLEAMAVGLPVVITDSCGLAPIIRSTGSGIVVDDSVDSLTAAVRMLLDDSELARSMGSAGARTARERFGMPKIAETLEAAYLA